MATIEDMTDEDHETFTVTLSNATSAAISGATATGTIENDDWPPLAWSTTLTVGHDFLAAEHYGYYASVGSLSTDPYFRYRSATYIVEQVTVTTGLEVFFNLHRSGLPTEDFMTLEIDGHEFPFEDRKSESTDKTWVWDAPAELHDPATNFPVGSTVLGVSAHRGAGVSDADADAERGGRLGGGRRGPDLHGEAVVAEHADGDGGTGRPRAARPPRARTSRRAWGR